MCQLGSQQPGTARPAIRELRAPLRSEVHAAYLPPGSVGSRSGTVKMPCPARPSPSRKDGVHVVRPTQSGLALWRHEPPSPAGFAQLRRWHGFPGPSIRCPPTQDQHLRRTRGEAPREPDKQAVGERAEEGSAGQQRGGAFTERGRIHQAGGTTRTTPGASLCRVLQHCAGDGECRAAFSRAPAGRVGSSLSPTPPQTASAFL